MLKPTIKTYKVTLPIFQIPIPKYLRVEIVSK
jgi:hypothetical protein